MTSEQGNAPALILRFECVSSNARQCQQNKNFHYYFLRSFKFDSSVVTPHTGFLPLGDLIRQGIPCCGVLFLGACWLKLALFRKWQDKGALRKFIGLIEWRPAIAYLSAQP